MTGHANHSHEHEQQPSLSNHRTKNRHHHEKDAHLSGIQGHTQHNSHHPRPTTEEEIQRLQQAYNDYLEQRLERKTSYLKAMHIRSLQEVPIVLREEESFNYTMEQEILKQIMRGGCDHCGEDLKHLDLTEIFRNMIIHRVEEFTFDAEV